MKRKYNITWLILSQFLVISLCSLMVPGWFWISSEYRRFEADATRIRSEYIQAQRFLIKKEVQRAADYIHYKKKQKEKRLKFEIRNRVVEAHDLALNLLKTHPDTDMFQVRKMVKEALRPIRYNNGRGYFFIFDTNGIEQLFPPDPAMEGKDMTKISGGKGEPVVPDMLSLIRSSGEGFYHYAWPKPDSEGFFPKIAFVKKIEPLDWVVGTGEYLDDVEKDIQTEIIDRVSRIRFENDGYVFLGNWNGLSLSGPAKGRNMMDVTDDNGVRIVQELINAARKGGGFVEYVLPRFEGMRSALKISYAQAIPEWEWYVGSGVYVDEIDQVIKKREALLKKQINSHIKLIGITLVLIWIIILGIARFISGQIKQMFSLFSNFFSKASMELIPIREEDIRLKEFVSLARSANEMVEKRISTQKTLAQSESKYRILFEKSKDAVLIIKNYIFIDCNQSAVEMLGYKDKEDLLQTHPSQLSPEFQPDGQDSYSKAKKMMDIAIENGSHRFEWDHVRANGDVFPVEVVLTAITNEESNQVIHTTWRDITTRKQAEKEKILAERHAANQSKQALVGQIAGKMAHDFNNILGVIMGNAELCRLDCQDEAVLKKIDLIFGQTVRGRTLTKNLIAFAKDQEPKQEFFGINEKIELVINLLKKDLEGVTLEKDYATGLPELLADPGMVEHALVNLIQNAVHALSKTPDPVISIKTWIKKETVCFTVKDNGCGIPENYLDQIYDPSFTLKGRRDVGGIYSKDIKGTGYGMSNVKRYIEQHRGSIEVASELQSGTSFTICIPVIKRALTPEEKTQVQQLPWAKQKNILLVEDESAISDVQSEILRQEPCRHHVDVAKDGKEAKEFFDQNQYDAVSLDYLLPGEWTGMDIYKYIRSKNRTIPILFISGNIEFLEALSDLQSSDPNVSHLSKPCFNKDYISKINGLLLKNRS